MNKPRKTGGEVGWYARNMDSLIDTQEYIAILTRAKILENHVESDREVSLDVEWHVHNCLESTVREMGQHDTRYTAPLWEPLASHVCGISWKVFFSAMANDFAPCGVSTAPILPIADRLYNRRLLPNLALIWRLNLHLTLGQKFKKLCYFCYFSFFWDFIIC